MKKLVNVNEKLVNVKCQKVEMFNLLDFRGTPLKDDKICCGTFSVVTGVRGFAFGV